MQNNQNDNKLNHKILIRLHQEAFKLLPELMTLWMSGRSRV